MTLTTGNSYDSDANFTNSYQLRHQLHEFALKEKSKLFLNILARVYANAPPITRIWLIEEVGYNCLALRQPKKSRVREVMRGVAANRGAVDGRSYAARVSRQTGFEYRHTGDDPGAEDGCRGQGALPQWCREQEVGYEGRRLSKGDRPWVAQLIQGAH